MYVIEDNEAAIKIVLKKRSMAMRHVLRTHRVALDWLYDLFDEDDIHIKYINTKWQVADMYTKSFTNADTWSTLCSLNSIGPVDSNICKIPVIAAKVASKGPKGENATAALQWTFVPSLLRASHKCGGCRSYPPNNHQERDDCYSTDNPNFLYCNSCNNILSSQVAAVEKSPRSEALFYVLDD